MGARNAAWVLGLASACFHPVYDRPACGPMGECPGGTHCVQEICEADGSKGGGGFADAASADAPTDVALDARPGAPEDGPGVPEDGPETSACVSVTYMALNVSVCPLTQLPQIEIMANTSLDTDAGTSIPPGLGCVPLSAASTNVCALAASSIMIASGVTLSAHGSRPLALIGDLIDVEGTIDVASHIAGQQGAASDGPGCNPGTRATGNGGGQGGTFAVSGGAGGDVDGSTTDKGGLIGPTIGVASLRGGCPGGPNSGGPIGGHGGGAVWLAADDGGVLFLGSAAVINASGAGGVGGATTAGNRGGYGGGSGGMILVQAPNLIAAPSSQLFADGGGGGGGGFALAAGGAGVDPARAGVGGVGGAAASSTTGAGGIGFPAAEAQRKGHNATATPLGGGGGGGGGGGAGAIWIDAQDVTGGPIISPPPVDLTSLVLDRHWPGAPSRGSAVESKARPVAAVVR